VRTVHDALDELVRELPDQIVGELIAKKIREHGIALSRRERKLLADQLRRGACTFRVKRWQWWRTRHISLEVTPADIEQATRTYKEMVEHLPTVFDQATEATAEAVLANLRRKWKAESRAQARDVTRFRRRHYKHWKHPMELLRMLVTISREVGESITNDLKASVDAGARVNLIEVIGRSHARGCQIAEEIICLLEGGFADGAIARWRSLHEVAVVATFIADQGETLAQRYVAHQAIESKRAADEYERCREDLGYEPIGEAQAGAIRAAYDHALAQFGPRFGKGDYGWAAEQLNRPQPTFKDIEHTVGVGHLRPYYRMASYNVHANPKGVFFKLGTLEESQVLLAGASNAGLADPGQCAALSVAQLSNAHGALDPTLDVCAALRIINSLVPEIADAFAEAAEQRARSQCP
jgi:hypothetical protein